MTEAAVRGRRYRRKKENLGMNVRKPGAGDKEVGWLSSLRARSPVRVQRMSQKTPQWSLYLKASCKESLFLLPVARATSFIPTSHFHHPPSTTSHSLSVQQSG